MTTITQRACPLEALVLIIRAARRRHRWHRARMLAVRQSWDSICERVRVDVKAPIRACREVWVLA